LGKEERREGERMVIREGKKIGGGREEERLVDREGK